MKIDSKAIKQLAKILDETGLNEIEVVEGEQVIRVNKGMMVSGAGVAQVASAPAQMPSDPTVPQAANTEMPEALTSDHPGAVTSPMVGTAYTSPEPDAPPFAKKGDSVSEGDTLMIIEAMKVMNPIKAHKGGTITKFLLKTVSPLNSTMS